MDAEVSIDPETGSAVLEGRVTGDVRSETEMESICNLRDAASIWG